MQVDPDLQATLLANVVVTGGTTLIPGFVDRLQSELATIAPGMKVKIRESRPRVDVLFYCLLVLASARGRFAVTVRHRR